MGKSDKGFFAGLDSNRLRGETLLAMTLAKLLNNLGV